MEKPKRKRHWPVLVLSILALIGLVYIFLFLPPGNAFSIISLQISYVFIFFPLIFLFFYGLVAFISRSATQGLLIASLSVTFLFFRFMHLTHPLFIILLLVLFASLEVVVWKKEI